MEQYNKGYSSSFSSSQSSRQTTRPPSPPPGCGASSAGKACPSPPPQQKDQKKNSYMKWIMGGGLPIAAYLGARWFLNRPATQMMINRHFNKGSRMIADAKTTMQKTDNQSQDALGPSQDQEEYKDIDDANSLEPSTSQKEHTHPYHTPLPNSVHVGFHE